MRTDHLDPAERQAAEDEDRLLAELITDYAARGTSADELLAAAAQAGDLCLECMSRLIRFVNGTADERPAR